VREERKKEKRGGERVREDRKRENVGERV